MRTGVEERAKAVPLDASLLPNENGGVGSEAIGRLVALWDMFAMEGAKNERMVGLERLLELVATHASVVVRCLEQFLSTPKERIVFSSPVAREIIGVALCTNESRESTSALVGRLLARGYQGYADLGA